MGQTFFDGNSADQGILQGGDICLSDHLEKNGCQSNELIFCVWSRTSAPKLKTSILIYNRGGGIIQSIGRFVSSF